MSAALPGGWQTEASIWQLVECCGYDADLPVWDEICEGSVLDLGCGIGRVAHHLASGLLPVLGIDRDPLMLRDFSRLAPDGATALVGDVLDPALAPGRFRSVIAPQQLIQILGGPEHRGRLLRLIAAGLDPDGTGALALTENLPVRSSAPDLLPDIREIDQWIYSSRPDRLEAHETDVTVERVRQRVSPAGDLAESRDRITFARLDRDSIRPELLAAGLELQDVVEVPPTDAHMGCSILLLRPSGRRQ